MTTDKTTTKEISGLQTTTDSPFGGTSQIIIEGKNSATYVNAITTSQTNAELKTDYQTQGITTKTTTTDTTNIDKMKVGMDTTITTNNTIIVDTTCQDGKIIKEITERLRDMTITQQTQTQ